MALRRTYAGRALRAPPDLLHSIRNTCSRANPSQCTGSCSVPADVAQQHSWQMLGSDVMDHTGWLLINSHTSVLVSRMPHMLS